jgi:hypothetical protein
MEDDLQGLGMLAQPQYLRLNDLTSAKNLPAAPLLISLCINTS